MQKRLNVLLVGLMLVVAQSASAAMNVKESKMTAGVTGGLGIGFGSTVTTGYRLGVNGAYFVMPKLSVGLLALINSTSSGVAGLASVSTFSLAPMAQAKYFVWEGLSVGLDAGVALGFSSTSVLSVSTTTTSAAFQFGPAVGYDFAFMDMLSAGAEVDFWFNTQSFGNPVLQALANIKYRF